MGKYEVYEHKMDKCINYLVEEYDTVRAGRANAAVLDRVTVDYYGAPSPIAQVASISTPDPRTLMITPWDQSLVKEIEKAILASEVGITPTNDGKSLRLSFPQPTEERRKELLKTVSKKAEETKVSIRGVRRDAIEAFKKQQKASEITEDDLKDIEKDIQKLTDDKIKEIDNLAAKKEKEIMEI